MKAIRLFQPEIGKVDMLTRIPLSKRALIWRFSGFLYSVWAKVL